MSHPYGAPLTSVRLRRPVPVNVTPSHFMCPSIFLLQSCLWSHGNLREQPGRVGELTPLGMIPPWGQKSADQCPVSRLPIGLFQQALCRLHRSACTITFLMVMTPREGMLMVAGFPSVSLFLLLHSYFLGSPLNKLLASCLKLCFLDKQTNTRGKLARGPDQALYVEHCLAHKGMSGFSGPLCFIKLPHSTMEAIRSTAESIPLGTVNHFSFFNFWVPEWQAPSLFCDLCDPSWISRPTLTSRR